MSNSDKDSGDKNQREDVRAEDRDPAQNAGQTSEPAQPSQVVAGDGESGSKDSGTGESGTGEAGTGEAGTGESRSSTDSSPKPSGSSKRRRRGGKNSAKGDDTRTDATTTAAPAASESEAVSRGEESDGEQPATSDTPQTENTPPDDTVAQTPKTSAAPVPEAGGAGESAASGREPDTAIQRQAGSHKSSTSSGSTPPATPRRKRGWGKFFLWLLILVLLVGLVAAGLFWGERELESRSQEFDRQLEGLQSQLGATEQQLARLEQQQDQAQGERQSQAQSQAQRERELAQRLDDLEQTITRNTSRLRALSTTTREDWLLAEAEYLLKLANQRLVIERSTEAAIALLQQADKILRDLDDSDLMPLRRAIARDLTKLKLADEIDLEGLYLRLASLAETVVDLPVRQDRQAPTPSGESTAAGVESTEEQSWWQRPVTTLRDMFTGLDDYVRVRDHSERPKPILPPDAEQYLQQNLRLMLEKAQLAALRGETQLYQNSLQNVVQWAQRYYPQSPKLERFVTEVKELADVDVQLQLPDITQSRELLTNYIDRLHKLKDVEGANDSTTEEQQ